MRILQDDYNTQRLPLKLSEYGRHLQEYVQHIKSLDTKEKRTEWAESLLQIMTTLTPDVKQQNNYREKLWDYLYELADYELDVNCPYPAPTPAAKLKKPDTIGYPKVDIKFRFYGRNLQNMVDQAAEMTDLDLRQNLVNLIASFMYNSCKSWNNENLSNETIAEHLKILSKGKLVLAGEELVVSQDNSPQRRFFNKKSNNRSGKNNKFNRGNKGGGGYRRY